MNSPKVVVSLGLILIFSAFFTACSSISSNNTATTPPPGTPIIETALLPQGAVGVVYGVNGQGAVLSAIGGKTPYTWSIVDGSLPPGLTLNSTTGVISGTPTTLGNYIFMVQVTDSLSMSYRKQLNIYIEGVVSITPALLPTGTPNVPYTPVQLMATGGLTPYTWCVVESSGTCDDGTGGALPPGLSMSTGGVISGTPTTDGIPTVFTVRVMDSETAPGVPAVGSASFSITVISIVTTTLPPGYLNTAYNNGVTVAGGIQPYTWCVVEPSGVCDNGAGILPPGLSLDPVTCAGSNRPMCKITGTPTTVGVYTVTFMVTDGEKSNPAVAMATLTIDVFQSQLLITTTSLPAGVVNVPYSATLQATGGIPPYTWCIFERDGVTCDNGAGILPTGLTFNTSSGVISGTPTTAGTTALTVQAADSGTPQQMATSGTLNILINPAITNSALSGNYVFSFSGYNSGTPVMMAGSFVADGKGNITSGLLDYNDGTGEAPDNNPTPQTISAGSVYNITPNGLGTLTLKTNLSVFQFAIIVKSDGSGRLIQSDQANKQAYGSGAIKVRNTNASPQQLSGVNFAVGFFGFDPSLQRYAGAGVFQFVDDQGDFAGLCGKKDAGCLDIDDAGAASSQTFIGDMFNFYDSTTGRGVAGMTFKPKGDRHFFASYLITANEMVIVATEPISQPANMTLWSGLRQLPAPPIGFDNTILSNYSVAELNALDTNGAVDVTAGLFAGKGVSGDSCESGQGGTFDPATFTFDENQGGTSSLQQSSTGMYCVDKATARVTLNSFTGQFGAFPQVFYMVTADQGFVVGTDPAVTSGILEAQTVGSPFNNSSVSGPYVGGTVTPITSAVTDVASWLFADGGGNINGSENTSGPGGPAQQNFNYTYTVDSTGRAVVQNGGSTIRILYVVSPQKFVMLPTTDPNPALSIFNQ